ncbi:MAG: hypothetical protein NVSMB32_04730 [Actinomycetota bacterium]
MTPRAPSPPFDIPRSVSDLLSAASITEYAYLTPRGEPLCWPVTPYWYPDRGVLGIATGLAYPSKAYYARTHHRVSALFDVGGSGSILIQGDAVVLDDDLQANTDRYVREMRAKFLSARVGLNSISVKLLDFYLPRLWIEITPVRVVMARGDSEIAILGAPYDPLDTLATSTTGPLAHSSAGGDPSPPEGLPTLQAWVRRRGVATITVVGRGGYPSLLRTPVSGGAGAAVALERSPGFGPAALTLHTHGWGGVRLDALMARGSVRRSEEGLAFHPRRVVGFLGSNPTKRRSFLSIFPLSELPRAAELRRRLASQLAARGESLPHLRVPR